VVHVLIVAAYASVRAGLHALLSDAGDCVVVGEVGSGAEMERMLPETQPEVVLLDEADGETAGLLPALVEAGIGLVVLGGEEDGPASLARSALHAWAYLPRDVEGTEIAAAVRAVAAGLIALHRDGVGALVSGASPDAELGPPKGSATGETLTAREREVLQWMAQGLPNKGIAARLGISTHTVKFHVAAILAKLGAASRTEAVALGIRRGDVTL
jgi:DNA-binding NarL/FixJ family response regulator